MELITDNEIMFGIYKDDMTWFDDDDDDEPEYTHDHSKTGGSARRIPLTY